MWLFLSLVFLIANAFGSSFMHTVEALPDGKKQYTLSLKLKPQEILYKNSLTLSSDNPQLHIDSWSVLETAQNIIDPEFKDGKEGYFDKATIRIITSGKANQESHLHLIYQTNRMAHPEDHIIAIRPEAPRAAQAQETSANRGKYNASATPRASWAEKISSLLHQTSSLPIRLLLVFLLGLLLSLTPCIYPMIPITIGILQAHGSKSLLSNFFVSLLYTCGMATTFALFGVLASCVGPLCGKLLVQPAFIIAFVALLAYFAFSMFGFYDMYVPSFMNTSASMQRTGSYFSVFLFGAASGTIASPCVSPGLALVLTVAATLGNSLLGFLLLFAFGVGLSMPLLLVGTFSSSLNMLPRAGMWMIEIKKLFGFMILGMCFYYLSYICPVHYLFWIAAILLVIIGIFYIYSAQRSFGFWKAFNHALGIALIAGAVMAAYKGFKEYTIHNAMVCNFAQEPVSYACALEQAKAEHKLIFVDFWATFCPVCLAINKKVLPNALIKKALERYVVLKVDGTYSANEPYASLEKKYSITGFPVFLIIDPATEEVLARWGSEIYDMKPADLAEKLYRLRGKK